VSAATHVGMCQKKQKSIGGMHIQKSSCPPRINKPLMDLILSAPTSNCNLVNYCGKLKMGLTLWKCILHPLRRKLLIILVMVSLQFSHLHPLVN
jgi:hypothetical protein